MTAFLTQEFLWHEEGGRSKFFSPQSGPFVSLGQLAVLLEGYGAPQAHSTALLKHFLHQNKDIIHYGKLPVCSHYCRFAFWFLRTRVSQPLGRPAESSAPTFPLFLLDIYRDIRWIPCNFIPWLLRNPPMQEKVLSIVSFQSAVQVSVSFFKPWDICCCIPSKNQLWRLVLSWKSLWIILSCPRWGI